MSKSHSYFSTSCLTLLLHFVLVCLGFYLDYVIHGDGIRIFVLAIFKEGKVVSLGEGSTYVFSDILS